MKIIVTHGANFHSDDIFAVATLLIVLGNKAKVIRTSEPDKYAKSADYIVDIGRVYDAKKGRFDHHQEGGAGERKNGVPYASFGLVWKEFGQKLTGSKLASLWVDRQVVQGIDGMDNGMYMYKPIIEDVYPFIFSEYFGSACDVIKGEIGDENVASRKDKKLSKENSQKFDREFMRLVKIAQDVLRVFIIKSKQYEEIMKKAKKAYAKAKDKRIIISDSFIPTRFEEFKPPKYIQPIFFIYPDLRGGWSAKSVPKYSQDYEAYKLFPKSWRGKDAKVLQKITGVEDVIFCHNAGFLAVAKSKEGAISLVKKVLS